MCLSTSSLLIDFWFALCRGERFEKALKDNKSLHLQWVYIPEISCGSPKKTLPYFNQNFPFSSNPTHHFWKFTSPKNLLKWQVPPHVPGLRKSHHQITTILRFSRLDSHSFAPVRRRSVPAPRARRICPSGGGEVKSRWRSPFFAKFQGGKKPTHFSHVFARGIAMTCTPTNLYTPVSVAFWGVPSKARLKLKGLTAWWSVRQDGEKKHHPLSVPSNPFR